MSMVPSANLLQLLEKWEGLRTKPYPDSGGVPTIGIGHVLSRAERMSGKITIGGTTVRYAGGITEDQARLLLFCDLAPVAEVVDMLVAVPLYQHQYDALCSFAYNVGRTAFAASTLLKRLNEGKYGAVPAQLRRWVYDNGVRVAGLQNRREKEVELWEGRIK